MSSFFEDEQQTKELNRRALPSLTWEKLTKDANNAGTLVDVAREFVITLDDDGNAKMSATKF